MLIATMSMAALAASVEQAPSLAELGARSSCVVSGVVTATEVGEVPWGLASTYTIEVSSTLRGSCGDEVAVTLPGGRADDGSVQAFSGVPLWDLGDEVLVFLDGEGRAPLTGVFTVDDDQLLDPLGRGDRVLADDLPSLLGR